MIFISRGRSFEKVDMIGIPYKLTEFICEDESISCIELDGKIFPVRYNEYADVEFLNDFLEGDCIYDYCKRTLKDYVLGGEYEII